MTENLSGNPNGGRFDSLQALRGIAALMVATAHLYSLDQRFFGGPVLSPFVQIGFAGVDLFFVLSGFVMVHLTRVGVGNAAVVPAFLFARAARLYPLWWIALGTISIVWVLKPNWVFASISGAPNLLADFALWPSERPPLLAVGWTLIHEMYFYIVFGLLLVLPSRYMVYGLMMWLLLVISGNVMINSSGTPYSPFLTLLTHPLTLEFGLGAAVGLLATKGLRPISLVLFFFGLVWLITTSLLAYKSPVSLFESSWSRTLAYGPAWALVLWGIVGLEADSKFVPFRPLVILGDASYALYLLHVPVFAAVSRLVAPYCGPSPWDNVVAWVSLLTIACISALLVHRYIERPILARLTKVRRKLMPKGSALMPSPPPPLGMRLALFSK